MSLEDPSRTLREHYQALYENWPQKWPGVRAIGYFCTYIPEELFIAAGLDPIRIIPGVGESSLSQAHLQSYTCYLSRACLHRALKGELDFLEGFVFAHTCDTIQGLADIWKAACPNAYVEVFNMPTVLQAAGALNYTLAELERLKASLEAHFDARLDERGLRWAILLSNRRRQLLADLARRRVRLSAVDFFHAVNAAMTMPLGEAVTALKTLLDETEDAPPRSEGVRLMVAGSTLDDPGILEAIEAAGGFVVDDDLCNGTRYFESPADVNRPPLEAVAHRLLERPLCPCKFIEPGAYARRLVEKARRSRIQGVILVRQKFCDPWGWEYTTISSALKEARIPHTLLEVEQPGSLGPLNTRIQAFIEKLEGEIRG